METKIPEPCRKYIERNKRGFEFLSSWKSTMTEDRLPQRKTKYSGAYDIAAGYCYVVEPGEVRFIATGLKVYMQPDEVLLVTLRSGWANKTKCCMPNGYGLIDSDYYNNPENEGHIFVPVFNMTDEPLIITEGTRIAQGMFTKFLISDNDNPGGMRLGGLGSTGYFGKHKDDEPEDR